MFPALAYSNLFDACFSAIRILACLEGGLPIKLHVPSCATITGKGGNQIHKCIKQNGSRDCFLVGGKVRFPWQNPFFSSRVQQQASILQSQIPSGNYFFPWGRQNHIGVSRFCKKKVEKYPWRCQFDQVVKGWSHPKWRFRNWIRPQILEGLVIIYIYIVSFSERGQYHGERKWHIEKRSKEHVVVPFCSLGFFFHFDGITHPRRLTTKTLWKKCWETSRRFFFFGFSSCPGL